MTTGLVYYKLVSPYSDDYTANCKLSINQIDSNFFNLKSADISAATYVRDEDSKGTLVLIRNNGDKIVVPIDTTIDKNLTYDFNASAVCGDEKGQTLTITWKDDEGVEKKTVIENIITADNLIDVIGSDILTKVITDSSLKGLGTLKSPLGLAGIEKTGMLAPAIKVIDLTDPTATPLPKDAKEGTRYVTKEYVNDYGYLYNGDAISKIQGLLDYEYEDNEIGKEVCGKRELYWRVPSKNDWDKLLNSIEPCNDYRNHNSAQCHKELGKLASKYLKSECGWLGQDECDCSGTKPYNSCNNCKSNNAEGNDGMDDYMFDNTDTIPSDAVISPSGIDKYGMTIRPSGNGLKKNGRPSYYNFKEAAFFWTTTHVHGDQDQDVYVKVFEHDKSGVYQVAECPDPYYSVRLVKDYDGSNYRAVEYIDGVAYKAVLFPESKQIWLGSSFANKKDKDGEKFDYLIPNNGDIVENRTEMFINEYNGRYWEKKVMEEGVTIVIQNPCSEQGETREKEICYETTGGVKYCITVEIEYKPQKNAEYRVVTDNDDTCSKILINTDDYILERILDIVGELIVQERYERIEADNELQEQIDELASADTEIWEALSAETEARISADTDLWEALLAEVSARTDADDEIWDAISALSSGTTEEIEKLWEALSAETEARISADTILAQEIDAERERAISAETALSGAIEDERDRAISAETALDEKIDAETERAKEAEAALSGQSLSAGTYTLSASTSDLDIPNLVIPSNDGKDEHSIKIKFDGNFGTISW